MMLFFWIVLYLITCIGLMGMFRQLDADPALAWIPVINIYVLVSKTWQKPYFWMMLWLAFTCLLLPYLHTANGHPLQIASWIARTTLAAMYFFACLHTAQVFGKGVLAGIMFFLLPFITSFCFARCKKVEQPYTMSPEDRMEMSRLEII